MESKALWFLTNSENVAKTVVNIFLLLKGGYFCRKPSVSITDYVKSSVENLQVL